MAGAALMAHEGQAKLREEEERMQLEKKAKAGTEDFGSLISSNGYYVDKTRFLRPLLTNTDDVVLFTRPRRFGKTLTMSMLGEFLGVCPEDPGSTQRQQRLFKGLDVMEDQELCKKFMGQFPVISMTLKDIDGMNFDEAIALLAEAVATVALRFDVLPDSPKLSPENKQALAILRSKQALLAEKDLSTLKTSIPALATMLCKHFGRQVVVIIDEYEVPLSNAKRQGYHEAMVSFYKGFMGFLKLRNWETPEIPIAKTVMTGCLRVAKNHIFTGANNFTPYTVVSTGTIFSTLMGFTPKETEEYLKAFGLSEYMDLVKRHYDGYRFDGDEIFNPWDIAKFVAKAADARDKAAIEGEGGDGWKSKVAAENFWLRTESTSTTAIKKYVDVLREDDRQRLQALSDGKEAEVEINDNMDYDSLDVHKARDMWSLLLHTGYLTATKVVSEEKCVVRIPNAEIKKCFDDSIMASFNEAIRRNGANVKLAYALLQGDTEQSRQILQAMVDRYVSTIRIEANRNRPENFYEGMLHGIMLSCGDDISDLRIEPQMGRGFADIVFRSKSGDAGVVLELKAAKSTRSGQAAALKAIAQIKGKKYASEYLANTNIKSVEAVGIAFVEGECFVESERLKGVKKA